MNKLIVFTIIISLAYFSYLKYFTTHTADVYDFILLVFASMFFGAWMIAALIIANELTEKEDKEFSK